MTRRPRSRRAGFALTATIIGLGLMAAVVIVLARCALLEAGAQRRLALLVHAEQVAASAHTWTASHAEDLRPDEPVVLPIAELLPAGTRGHAELRRADRPEAGPIAVCIVTLERGGQRLRRQWEWPLGR